MKHAHTITSLTNDILEELDTLEKTAQATTTHREFKSEFAKELVKIAQDLSCLSDEITYADIEEFRRKVGV